MITMNQLGLVVLFSLVAAGIITLFSKWYKSFVEKMASANLEQYNTLLTQAQNTLEQMVALQKENRLVTKFDTDSEDFVQSCADSLEKYKDAAIMVSLHLKQHKYHLAIRSFVHLRKFTKSVKKRICFMEETINLSSK